MEPDQAQRPILAGFHPDPSVCRAADGYYLVTSSFEYVPGVPIYRSRDLRDWEQVGHVLDRRSQLDVSRAAPSGGIFAPTLRYHDGRFYLITTNVSDGGGHLLVTATDPAGPWSEPIRMPGLAGIDPDLAWDADGTCYLTWSGYRDHRPVGIVQAILDPRTGTVHAGPQLIWNGTGGQYPEGPHLHVRDGVWYLVIAEGGTERGH
ncbi:MAG: xylan 1,4-beta-xylosidase, partial [Solirubrobacteraceae bacterium]|nr:xylan 1,4-beta-xylosidase [Solirubrobacteraceae bacterium]